MKNREQQNEPDDGLRHVIPPDEIIRAYSEGYFPMAESERTDADIFFYTAPMRGIIPLDSFHMPKRSLRYFRKYKFEYRMNTRFEQVIDGCADRESTWINPVIRNTFVYLHQQGKSHSFEVFRDGQLAGGLYGLALGGAFFAESVFQYHDEAHKAALWYCHQRLTACRFTLWDTQFQTEHLSRFGCTEIHAKNYKKRLQQAIILPRNLHP